MALTNVQLGMFVCGVVVMLHNSFQLAGLRTEIGALKASEHTMHSQLGDDMRDLMRAQLDILRSIAASSHSQQEAILETRELMRSEVEASQLMTTSVIWGNTNDTPQPNFRVHVAAMWNRPQTIRALIDEGLSVDYCVRPVSASEYSPIDFHINFHISGWKHGNGELAPGKFTQCREPGRTALALAVRLGHMEAATALLEKGAAVDLIEGSEIGSYGRRFSGRCSLLEQARMNKQTEMVALLESWGALERPPPEEHPYGVAYSSCQKPRL